MGFFNFNFYNFIPAQKTDKNIQKSVYGQPQLDAFDFFDQILNISK